MQMHHKSSSSKKFAVKIYSKNNSQDAQVRHFKQELKLESLSHSNIIQLIDFNENGKWTLPNGETQDVRYAVLELAPNGNLLDYISFNWMDEKIVRYYFKQLWSAVDYIHKKGACHRDLKLENLLLDEDFNLKVSDFGFWTTIFNKLGEKLSSTCKGTPGYMAPEMMNIGGFNYVTNQKSHKYFNSNGYNGEQSDVFALGVILFSLLMGRPPFKIADINDPFYRLIFTQQTSEFWKPWDQFAVQNNFKIDKEFKNLFISMVTYSPIMRLSLNEVLNSKWMKCSNLVPTNKEVVLYMNGILQQIKEKESQQQVDFNQTLSQTAQRNENQKECSKSNEENLNDSSLSWCSQIKDDDELIMSDLQEIEKALYENDRMNEDHHFDLEEHDEFNLGSFSNSNEFYKTDEEKVIQKVQDSILTTNESQKPQVSSQNQQEAILEVLDNMIEVDAEVRTTVPEKILSFLSQYSKMKEWKMVQISNYVLLKIPDLNSNIVEYALKFDKINAKSYALKFLKNETISNEQFHSVGWFILELLSPYC